MSNYINLPASGGGGAAGVDSVNGAIGALTLVPGSGIDISVFGTDITISATAVPITGDPDTFAGFDDSGNLYSVPGRGFNSDTFGEDINSQITVIDSASGTLNVQSTSLNPTENSPDTSWSVYNIFTQIDPDNTGFDVGTSGSALKIFESFIQYLSTGNLGSISYDQVNLDLGNGTDPVTINGLSYFQGGGDVNSGVTISNEVQGFEFNPNFHAGSILTQGVAAYSDSANAASVGGYTSFAADPHIVSMHAGNNYNGLSINPTIDGFNATGGYTGVSIGGNLTNLGSNGFQGINIDPNITNAGSGFIGAINISLANVLGSANGVPTAINTNDARINFSNLADADNFGFQCSTEIDTGTSGAFSGLIGVNSLGGNFHIASGFPITGGAFGIGNNLGIGIFAEDNMPPDSSGFGLGFVMNGFLTQVAVAATKTFTSLTFMGAGASATPQSTGGTITDAHMFRAIGLVPGGGTLNITNIYGYYVDTLLSALSPTNAWGIYVADTNADNFFAKNVVIGGITGKPVSTEALSITGQTIGSVSMTDSGAIAAEFSATSNTTVSGSNTTIGLNGSATGTVQVGAENDKTIGALNFTVTRGDGADQGLLDTMTGTNVLMFHDSDAAGTTSKAYGMSTIFFSEGGTVIDLYDFYSLRVPAGPGVVNNHYGVYIENDSTTPVVNWLSGNTQLGGSSLSTPVKTLEITGDVSASGDIASATLTPANGATGTFTTVDLKTVTVTNGIIVSIV